MTESFLLNRLPIKEFVTDLQPLRKKRRLSRQQEVTDLECPPPGVPHEEHRPRMRAHKQAAQQIYQCEWWLAMIKGAVCALTVLEIFFQKSSSVAVNKVVES